MTNDSYGTPEQIAAALAKVRALKAANAPIREMRLAYLELGRLKRPRVTTPRGKLDKRLRQALRLENDAREAQKSIVGLVKGVSLTGVISRIVTIGEGSLLDCIQEDLKTGNTKERAQAVAHMMKLMSDIVDLYRTLQAAGPVRKERVARPGWPSEAMKA